MSPVAPSNTKRPASIKTVLPSDPVIRIDRPAPDEMPLARSPGTERTWMFVAWVTQSTVTPLDRIREGADEILVEVAPEQVAFGVVDPPADDRPIPRLEDLVPIAEKLAGLVDGRIAERQVADDAAADAVRTSG